MKSHTDNKSDGCSAWLRFVKENLSCYGLNHITNEVLYNAGRGSYQVMHELGTNKIMLIHQLECSHWIDGFVYTAAQHQRIPGNGMSEVSCGMLHGCYGLSRHSFTSET